MGIVTIHVVDDARKLQQDFTCELHTLLASMRYFQCFLKKVGPAQDVEISVHCDVVVFAWLLRYTKTAPAPGTPKLTVENCLPILIASHFLQMDQLVKEGIQFIADNLLLIVELKLDIGNSSDDILMRLAKVISEHTLESLWLQCISRDDSRQREDVDRSSGTEQLVDILYKHKVDFLMKDHRGGLRKCRHCGELFPANHRVRLQCKRDGATLVSSVLARKGIKGQSTVQHEPQPSWTLKRYVEKLRSQQLQSWREIYWHLWGRMVVLPCHRCNSNFIAAQWRHCSYHAQSPIFPPATKTGHYPCCGQPAKKRFEGADGLLGCQAMEHMILSNKSHDKHNPAGLFLVRHGQEQLEFSLGLLQCYGHLVTVPYKPPPPPKVERDSGENPSCGGEEDDAMDKEVNAEVGDDEGSACSSGGAATVQVMQSNQEAESSSAEMCGSKDNTSQPKTLLGKIASSSSRGSGSHWSPSSKFKSSALGKALQVELVWEDDSNCMESLIAHLTNCRLNEESVPGLVLAAEAAKPSQTTGKSNGKSKNGLTRSLSARSSRSMKARMSGRQR